MGRFFSNLKRGKIKVEIYHNGEYIMTLSVSEYNKGNSATIDFNAIENVRYKIVKADEQVTENNDESFFNREEFNR